jgi:hypothetical protein
MKHLTAILIIFGKIYLGIRILWWAILKMQHPELHNISEIDVFLVLLVFDIWIGQQNIEIEKMDNKKQD